MFQLKERLRKFKFRWIVFTSIIFRVCRYLLDRKRNKFDFVIVGSAKCGTTSLHKYLNKHPDIFLPENVGINDETGFFLSDTDQKIKSTSNQKIRQYLSDFPLYSLITRRYKGEKLLGEETTDYTKFPYRDVNIEKMRNINPSMKIIFIIRDPIEKIESQYRHFLRHQKQLTDISFLKELENNDYYELSCKYYMQISAYIEAFGRKNVHVLLFEDLVASSKDSINNIFSFLGINTLKLDESYFVKHNYNSEVKSEDYLFTHIPQEIITSIDSDITELLKHFELDVKNKWVKFYGNS